MSFLYPRLLGSLKQVPVHYYTDGLVIDMFHFNDVHADDPLIIGSEYVDMPAHALPELKGADFS